MRNKWVHCINYLKSHLERRQSIKEESEEKAESWRAKNLDEATRNSAQAESEIIERSRQTTMVDDYSIILNDKGITPFIAKLDQAFIEPRVCLGYLNKKGHINLTKYKKRFFILFSSKSLDPSVSDNKLLTAEQLPPWCEPNVLYYFKHDKPGDDSPFLGSISISQCEELFVENSTESINFLKTIFKFSNHLNRALSLDKGYEFRIVTKDRTYSLCTDYITEMNKWIIAFHKCKEAIESIKPVKSQSLDEISRSNSVAEKKRSVSEDRDISKLKTYRGSIQIPSNAQKAVRKELNEIQEEAVEEKIIEPSGPCKEGYFYKKSSNKLVGWQKRYFVVKEELFSWFASNNDLSKSKNSFSADQVDDIVMHKTLKIKISFIEGPDLKLAFDCEEDTDKWFHFLKYWDSYYNCNSERRKERTIIKEHAEVDSHQQKPPPITPNSTESFERKESNGPVIIKLGSEYHQKHHDGNRTSTSMTPSFPAPYESKGGDSSIYDKYAMLESKLKHKSVVGDENYLKNFQATDDDKGFFGKLFGKCCVCMVKKKSEQDFYSKLS